ncbi:permease-like cell division protein FtsX [Nocardia stercoris]|uniref:Cell division protein FtsX n=1 Tax=Nocardia stercoris TaxID=2483361 RepID=A0A3M2LDX3_9NOCA|nr:permease-like cell division protein FtsX [Nocardia stercoris]RMI35236.1 ABC transporter permease [Nocardia stercoris]
MRIGFLFTEIYTGFRRNVTMTLATVLTTMVSLIMFGGGMLAVQMTQHTESVFLGRLEVRLFLDPEVSANDPDCTLDPCKSLMADLNRQPGVTSVQFTDSAAAKKEATEVTFKDQPETAKMIQNTDFPASLRVKTTDPGQYPKLLQNYSSRPGVIQVHSDQEFVDRLVSMFDGLRNAAFGLAALMALGSLLLIANMVQVAALSRKEEVEIMRMVGATRWYTQLPFLLEVLIGAIAGSVFAALTLFAARPLIINPVLNAAVGSGVIPSLSNGDVAVTGIWMIAVGVVFAGAIGYGSLRYYVRD